MVAFGPLGSAFEGHGSSPPGNTDICLPKEFKDDICTDYFQNVPANSPLHRQTVGITDSKHSGVGVEAVLFDSVSDSWLVATTPGDSESAPLV